MRVYSYEDEMSYKKVYSSFFCRVVYYAQCLRKITKKSPYFIYIYDMLSLYAIGIEIMLFTILKKEFVYWRGLKNMVERDIPESIRSRRLCNICIKQSRSVNREFPVFRYEECQIYAVYQSSYVGFTRSVGALCVLV